MQVLAFMTGAEALSADLGHFNKKSIQLAFSVLICLSRIQDEPIMNPGGQRGGKKFGKSYEDLAMDGYMLLAKRLRDEDGKDVVQSILEKHIRVKIDAGILYLEDSTRW